MAAALARKHAPEWEIYSAGVATTEADTAAGPNPEAAASLAKVGAVMADAPTRLDPQLAARVDHVVVVGSAPYEGPAQRWEIVDPSECGMTGEIRMEALRDDIEDRVVDFIARASQPQAAPDGGALATP